MVELVTATIGGQLFGLPIARVQDVFLPQGLTRVPLAGAEVAGLLNLRGRILTVIDMRRLLGLEEDGASSAGSGAHPPSAPAERVGDLAAARTSVVLAERPAVALGIEHAGESYGLLIDEIGEVMKLPVSSREENPVNMERRLAHVSAGVHRLDGRILVVLDVDRVLDFEACARAA